MIALESVGSAEALESVRKTEPRRRLPAARGMANLREQVDMGQRSEPTVRCGCGRMMSPDGARGPGAYRCGCGLRVTVVLPEPRPRCAWLLENGMQCRLVPVPAQARSARRPLGDSGYVQPDDPVMLCAEHTKTWRALWFPEETSADRYNRLGLICDCSLATPERIAERERATERTSVVYYVRWQNLIKIGTTIQLKARLTALGLPGLQVLATEPGGFELEHQRHRQFAAHRQDGEWFVAGPDLLEHIEQLGARSRPNLGVHP